MICRQKWKLSLKGRTPQFAKPKPHEQKVRSHAVGN
jgi:hypothetical protein